MSKRRGKIELVYDQDCPNIRDTRCNLMIALVATGWPVEWTEWNQSDPGAPERVRRFGSPTILVDGADIVGGQGLHEGRFCRMYRRADQQICGVPPPDLIAAALPKRTRPPAKVGSWLRKLTPVPSVGIALLPKLACPACWPAYAGWLSTVGLGFLISGTNLFRLTAGCLALALGAIAFQAFARRRSGPLILAAIAAVGIVIGKFVVNSSTALYMSASVFVCASVLNAWPIRTKVAAGCHECLNLPEFKPWRETE